VPHSGRELKIAVMEETKVWPVQEINNYGVHHSVGTKNSCNGTEVSRVPIAQTASANENVTNNIFHVKSLRSGHHVLPTS